MINKKLLQSMISLRKIQILSEKRELATKPYQIIDTARSDERFAAKICILQ